MKSIIAITVFLASIVLAIYFGLWWAFIGGIVQVVESVTSDPVDAMGIALGILRVMLAGLIAWVTFLIGVMLSFFISD